MRFSTKLQQLHSKQTHAPQTITVAIFDFDGTLFDTEPYGTQCLIKAIQQQYTTPFTEQQKQQANDFCVGRSLHAIADYMARELAIDAKQLLTDYRDIWQQNIHTELAIHDSIQCVKQLQQHGLQLSICTGSEQHQITPLLNALKLHHHFNHFVCAEDYAADQGKPHPEPYLKALAQHNISAQHVVVFEDSTHGIQSAKAAGIEHVIALCQNEASETTLKAAGASLVTPSLNHHRVYQYLRPSV